MVSEVNNALKELTQLAKYGVLVTASGQVIYPSSIVSAGYLAAHGLSNKVPPSAGKSSYRQYLMTMTMAQDYDAILRSLVAVGVNTNAAGTNVPSLTLAQAQQWLNLSVQVPAIANIVQAAELAGYAGGKSLQAMIEIDYVQRGNQIITQNMAQLQSALNTTQQVLNYLASLQNLHNQITVNSSTFNFCYGATAGTNGPSGWSQNYQQAASAFFNSPVTPVLLNTVSPIIATYHSARTSTLLGGIPVSFPAYVTYSTNYNASGYVEAYKQLVNIRVQLSAQLSKLSAITSAGDRANTTSLYGSLAKVLKDLNTSFTVNGQPVTSATSPSAAFQGFKNWMLDNYSAYNSPNVTNAGQFQQHITFAITAAENLNDTQKATVRSYLFIFEEYYKSASAALQAITQIIQKMAQNIAR